MIVLQVMAVLGGGALIVMALLSAVKTFVLPRAEPAIIPRMVFVSLRRAFNLAAHPARTYAARDRVMAWFAPIGLLMLPGTWLILIVAGFTAIYWGLGIDVRAAFVLSGSTITTLGYERPQALAAITVNFVEAMI